MKHFIKKNYMNAYGMQKNFVRRRPGIKRNISNTNLAILLLLHFCDC